MKLVSVDKFLPRVLPYAENLPELVARRAISDASRDFMEEALNIEVTYRFTTVECEERYTLSLPYNLSCVLVRNVTIKGEKDTGSWQLTPVTAEALDTYSYPMSWRDMVGDPRVYLFRSPDEIVLSPCPDKVFTVACVCAATIPRDGLEVPDVLYEDYADIIADGALGKAFSMAGQTWSNPQLGGSYTMAFNMGVAKARVEAAKSYTRVGGRVIYNRWA